ncbi:MAG: aminotransferase class I/II-fold pyridoxal phosphate-dependent enzyme, partial [Thermoplasmata archaeon]
EPDLPPPLEVLDALRASIDRPGDHRYSSSAGEPELRQAIARFLKLRFGVVADPEHEVVVLLGSKEGLTLMPRLLRTRREVVGIPDPGYPAYESAAQLAGARPVRWPLIPEEGYAPDWDRLPARARLVYLNYPNNPTGRIADRDQLRAAVEMARDRGFALAYDNAYSEISFGDRPAPSIWEVPGAREVAVEFHSFSKTFGIPGWRLGFAVGPRPLIAAMIRYKSQVDSGPALPLQRAAQAGLALYRGPRRPAPIERRVTEYRRRALQLCRGLDRLGYAVEPPQGGLYVWHRARLASGAEEAERWLSRYGILVTPGGAFGPAGAPFVRWSVTRPSNEIASAVQRLGEPPKRFGVRPAGPRWPFPRPPGSSGSRRAPG